MSKGKIVLVPFPFTDLSGHKVRPCVVLAEQKNGEDAIVAFITSTKLTKLGNFTLKLKAGKNNGLKVDSTLRLDKLATLQKKIFLGELGILEATYIKQIDTQLKKLFQLS